MSGKLDAHQFRLASTSRCVLGAAGAEDVLVEGGDRDAALDGVVRDVVEEYAAYGASLDRHKPTNLSGSEVTGRIPDIVNNIITC